MIVIGRTLESLFVLERLPASVTRVLVIDDGAQRGSLSSTAAGIVSAGLGMAPRSEFVSSPGHLMRLPHTIHPGAKPLALKYFAEKTKRLDELVTVEHGSSSATFPTEALFVDFCDDIMAGLEQGRSRSYDLRTVKGSVVDVERHGGTADVVVACCESAETGALQSSPCSQSSQCSQSFQFRYRARAVVVSTSSLGYGVAPVLPVWWRKFYDETNRAPGTKQENRTINDGTPIESIDKIHARATDVGDGVGDEQRHVVVVGGGMMAATRVMDILRSSESSSVTLVARRALVKQAFDVDQGWWGTKYMHSYETLGASKRLESCRMARPRGSIRGDVYDALMGSEWIKSGRLCVLQGVDVQSCARIECNGGGERVERGMDEEGHPWRTRLRLRLVRHPELSKAEAMKSDLGGDTGGAASFKDIVCDEVELACGTAYDVATDPVLGPVVERDGVEVLGGYPVVEKDCRVRKESRIFVSGRGAMIALGPCGGNVVGMRMSAERICRAVAGLMGSDRVKQGDAGAGTELGSSDDSSSREYENTIREETERFDPVKRVTVWTSVDGTVMDGDGPSALSSAAFPLESSNPMSLLPHALSTKFENPLDPEALPCGKKTQLSSYAFSDDGFRLSILMTFPEAVSKDRVRIRVTRTSLEAWFIGGDTAYHLNVPRLYGNVLPERTVVIAKEDKCRVTLKLHKEKDVEWKFLKG